MKNNLLILGLDKGGNPAGWLSHEDAIRLITRGRTCGMFGEQRFTFLGGTNRLSGKRSQIDVFPIVLTTGEINRHLYAVHYQPPLTNRGLFRRDGGLCLYCGEGYPLRQLTRDHIIPLSRGGQNTWTNVVSACRRCNHAKADRTPEQWGHPLLAVPYIPNYAEHLILLNRRILADQRAFLMKRVSTHSRLSEPR
ncbi:MAG: HNH endonuclease [Gammaproteobacteria bacterium]